MENELYFISDLGAGSLYVMPKPPYIGLDTFIADLRQSGIKKIISLMEMDEADQEGLSKEKQYCIDEGIQFEQFPIVDGHIPDIESFLSFFKKISDEICDGLSVVIHCWAGIGRSGLAACTLLHLNGIPMLQAIEIVSEKRMFPVPETELQYHFLKQVENTLGSTDRESK